MTSPQVYCVLGMHRSGTSLIARILGHLGIYLGPPGSLVEPLSSNPKGHWEYVPFFQINDELLRMHGGDWCTPPQFTQGWQDDPRLNGLKEKAKSFVLKDFGASNIWGWKDPRTCITLPFWKSFLPDMRYVLMFRNPLEVAQSLNSRNHFPIQFGAELWLQHVHRALAHSRNESRTLLFYEDFLENWESELGRLAQFVGPAAMEHSVRNRGEILDFVDKELRHNRATPSQIVENSSLPAAVKSTYLALRLHLNSYRQAKDPDALRAEGEQLLALIGPEAGEYRQSSHGGIAGALLRGVDRVKGRIRRGLRSNG